MLYWYVRTIALLSVCSIAANIFCASADATNVILDGFVGGYSSFSDSRLLIPIQLETCWFHEAKTARHDAVTCGIGLKVEALSWLYPALRFSSASQQVREKHTGYGGPMGISSARDDCRMSLEVSSTTTFFWTDAGVEFEVPRKSDDKRSFLITGAGASFIYAEDRIHAGSKYVYHYELWTHDPVDYKEPATLEEFRHEEKDIGGFYSSGFGLGCYILLGFRFYISKALSLTFETRTNFGTIRLKSETGNASKGLRFDSGTIGVSCIYKL